MDDLQNDSSEARASQAARGRTSAELPADLFREVAASLQSLWQVLPEDELTKLTRRLTAVILRRELELKRQFAEAAERARLLRAGPEVDMSNATSTRLWDAARAYGKFLEDAGARAEVIQQARKAREEAAAVRARVASDRAKRAIDGEERARLRDAVRSYVAPLKQRGDSLDDVLHSTGDLLRRLRLAGDVADERGAFEVDVQRLVAEEYFSAA